MIDVDLFQYKANELCEIDENKLVQDFDTHVYDYSTSESLAILGIMKYIPAKMPQSSNKIPHKINHSNASVYYENMFFGGYMGLKYVLECLNDNYPCADISNIYTHIDSKLSHFNSVFIREIHKGFNKIDINIDEITISNMNMQFTSINYREYIRLIKYITLYRSLGKYQQPADSLQRDGASTDFINVNITQNCFINSYKNIALFMNIDSKMLITQMIKASEQKKTIGYDDDIIHYFIKYTQAEDGDTVFFKMLVEDINPFVIYEFDKFWLSSFFKSYDDEQQTFKQEFKIRDTPMNQIINEIELHTNLLRSDILYQIIEYIYEKSNVNTSHKSLADILEYWIENKPFFVQIVEHYDINISKPIHDDKPVGELLLHQIENYDNLFVIQIYPIACYTNIPIFNIWFSNDIPQI